MITVQQVSLQCFIFARPLILVKSMSGKPMSSSPLRALDEWPAAL
jgi:hypothetical protein